MLQGKEPLSENRKVVPEPDEGVMLSAVKEFIEQDGGVSPHLQLDKLHCVPGD